MIKILTVWITTNCGKFPKRWDSGTKPVNLKVPDHLTCLLRNLYASQEATVRTGHGTTDWFKLGMDYVKTVYCHPAYLTSMQSTSCEMPGWMKHKLESRLPREISINSDMQMTSPLWKK